MVIAETAGQYTQKTTGKQIDQITLTCLDNDTEAQYLDTFEFSLSADDIPKYRGKLNRKTIQLGISRIAEFGSKIRMSGKILSVK